MDASRLGQTTAALMESLDEHEGEWAPSDVEIGEVMVLAEIKVGEPDGPMTYIAWRCTDDRAWVQRGLLHAALDQERITDDEEDDDASD